ncbi:MAG: hypothetical protein KF700_01505 [Hyphomonadaceae bacterium]|nr:hypothetical protein [Hyphomonadaceae bacterium]
MRKRTLAVPLLLALGGAGCAATPTPSLDAFAAHSANNSFEAFDRSVAPPETLVLPVIHDRQTAGPSCGAHVLASVINYWNGPGAVSGDAIFAETPPVNPGGYSLAELMRLARANGLAASAVRLSAGDLMRELEHGRPVIVPIRAPAVYLQPWSLPGANEPILGAPARIVSARVARLSEFTGVAMVDHYLLVVGYTHDMFVVVEPILGFRTIEADRLARYRAGAGDAAIVLSGAHAPAARAGRPQGATAS